ncbi:Hypothetical predicted protein [Marmota monax]|uniref:Glycosyltransferase 2-like domain-containing protein n=1 Tax=Marmota monax TaxID=9995 RepID=A0A5E4ABY3_MARMO|nr:hypothetical protein GHT09_002828 [Marmota monax]VTJ54827.1 Hypothetical predicted protein [Marmota monax]
MAPPLIKPRVTLQGRDARPAQCPQDEPAGWVMAPPSVLPAQLLGSTSVASGMLGPCTLEIESLECMQSPGMVLGTQHSESPVGEDGVLPIAFSGMSLHALPTCPSFPWASLRGAEVAVSSVCSSASCSSALELKRPSSGLASCLMASRPASLGSRDALQCTCSSGHLTLWRPVSGGRSGLTCPEWPRVPTAHACGFSPPTCWTTAEVLLKGETLRRSLGCTRASLPYVLSAQPPPPPTRGRRAVFRCRQPCRISTPSRISAAGQRPAQALSLQLGCGSQGRIPASYDPVVLRVQLSKVRLPSDWATFPLALPTLTLLQSLNSLRVCKRHGLVARGDALTVDLLLLSLAEELKAPLEEYVHKRYPGLVKVVRNQKREGLIRARIEGWKVATGQVTGFFDAHVEFTAGWAEPVLSRIQENRKRVILPSIDNIKQDNFEVQRYENSAHGYSWELWCMYISPPKDWWDAGDPSLPIRSVTASSGGSAVGPQVPGQRSHRVGRAGTPGCQQPWGMAGVLDQSSLQRADPALCSFSCRSTQPH